MFYMEGAVPGGYGTPAGGWYPGRGAGCIPALLLFRSGEHGPPGVLSVALLGRLCVSFGLHCTSASDDCQASKSILPQAIRLQ